MLRGDNGILTRATEAKETTGIAQIQEQINLAYHAALTKGLGKVNESDLEDAMKVEFKDKLVDNELPNGWLDKTSVTGKWRIKIDNVYLDVPAGTTTGDSNENQKNNIPIVATVMLAGEVGNKGISFQRSNSTIVKVTQDVPVPTKNELQTLEETDFSRVKNMYVKAESIYGNYDELTWDEIVEDIKNIDGYENITVQTASEAFNAKYGDEGVWVWVDDVGDVQCRNVYDFIIQTGAYKDQIEQLKYKCNNEEKIGKEVYFELSEAGSYEITAMDESNEVVGKTNYQLIIKTVNVYYSLRHDWGNWTEFGTLDIYPPSRSVWLQVNQGIGEIGGQELVCVYGDPEMSDRYELVNGGEGNIEEFSELPETIYCIMDR